MTASRQYKKNPDDGLVGWCSSAVVSAELPRSNPAVWPSSSGSWAGKIRLRSGIAAGPKASSTLLSSFSSWEGGLGARHACQDSWQKLVSGGDRQGWRTQASMRTVCGVSTVAGGACTKKGGPVRAVPVPRPFCVRNCRANEALSVVRFFTALKERHTALQSTSRPFGCRHHRPRSHCSARWMTRGIGPLRPVFCSAVVSAVQGQQRATRGSPDRMTRIGSSDSGW